MAQSKITFRNSERFAIEQNHESELLCHANRYGEIFVGVYPLKNTEEQFFNFVCLDIETAQQLKERLQESINLCIMNLEVNIDG